MSARIEAMPSGVERTQALVDFNAMLVDRHDLLAARVATPAASERLRDAALFMLDLVDQYYGTDHEFDIPEEAEFRRHCAVIERLVR